MDAKIDSMAKSGALDPALLLTIAKAHSSVKDTDYSREEVKDVMAHLYFKVSTVCTCRFCTLAVAAHLPCYITDRAIWCIALAAHSKAAVHSKAASVLVTQVAQLGQHL